MVDVTDSAHLGAPGPVASPTIYVFGCFDDAGHWIWTAGRRHAATGPAGVIPYDVSRQMDCVGYSTAEQVEGRLANRLQVPGWSGVTWWDRQGDRRGNSHTGLLAFGDFTPAELVALGREQAPWAFRVDVRIGGAP